MGASVSVSVAVIAEMTTQITVLPVTPTMPPLRALGNCPVGILHAALPTTPLQRNHRLGPPRKHLPHHAA
jgi:hypothetical protein